jgi:hypothetical protein
LPGGERERLQGLDRHDGFEAFERLFFLVHGLKERRFGRPR